MQQRVSLREANQHLSRYVESVERGKERVPVGDATDQVRAWQTLFPVVAARTEDLDRAVTAVLRHGLIFWEAMLWAAAKAAGVTVLLSEEFQHERELEVVRFRNPFAVPDPLEGGRSSERKGHSPDQ